MHRVIDERPLADTAVSEERAREFLGEMVRARVFDERAVALQRRGWMSGYPPFEGQEASQVGAAHALGDDDWLFPTYRSNALQLARGRPPADILQFRRGRSAFESRDGDAGGVGHGATGGPSSDTGRARTFTQATPIATHLPHAVGAAMAAAHRARTDAGDADASSGADAAGDPVADHVACAYFGDGATSEGDFHEAMNFAGVFDAPVVFLCENNHWAISLPADRQTASATIAAKADAYGFDGVRVDGNDPVAVYETVRAARESALAGDPVLVESLTYRQGAHTTSDDPDRYRDAVDLPDWRTADPIDRYEEYLRDAGVIDAGFVADARAAAEAAMDEAVAAVEGMPDPDAADLFDHAYATLSPRLVGQRAFVEQSLDRENE